ncbi:MAG: NAD(+)/NADH kinase [Anaerolineae bacterium]|jgi:NAD+ kinase
MKLVGILYNPRPERALLLAGVIAMWLKERGLEAEIATTYQAATSPFLQEADLLVTLGGDGSILRVARAAAPYSTPILGINLGRVGFLTEAEPDMWKDVLSRALDGDYWVEERMMLKVAASRGDEELVQATALNDVVVGRGERARVVYLRAEVDGGYLASYAADGLVVATPTGSTAYALAAGGPILPPELRNIVLVPVAPHLSMERPVVLSEGATVRIVVAGRRAAVLTVDGEVQAELVGGDEVVVEASPYTAHFARVQEQTYFYKTLVERLVPRDHASTL